MKTYAYFLGKLMLPVLILFVPVKPIFADDIPRQASNQAQPHQIPSNFLGVNVENAYGADFQWNDPNVINTFKRIGLQAARFPGGQVSNYWNWQSGWFYPAYGGYNANNLIDSPYTFSILTNSTKTYPLYDLNVLTYNNSDINTNSLSSPMNNQEQLLNQAKQDGLTIGNIELGNELGNDWSNVPDYAKVYPSGTAYATTMNQWIASLKTLYPQAKIAVVGNIPGGDSRTLNWNSEVLSNIKNADAMTVHRYDPAVSYSAAYAEAVLANVFSSWQGMMSHPLEDISNAGLKAWITEYGGLGDCSSDSHFTGTWLEALYGSEMLVQFLSHPAVSSVNLYNFMGSTQSIVFGTSPNYWNSCLGKNINFSATPFELTATGQAYTLFGRALNTHGALTAVGISFPESPLINQKPGEPPYLSYPALSGVWISGTDGSNQWILTNLSGQNVTLSYPGMGQGKMESLYSNSLMTIVNSDNSYQLTAVSKAFNGTSFTLPPYSVNRIQSVVPNLLSTLQDLNSTTWQKSAVSTQKSLQPAPDGSMTAQIMTEDKTVNPHGIGANFTLVPGQNYVFSAYVKSANRKAHLVVYDPKIGHKIQDAICDPATGTLDNGNMPMINAGNGWYHCSVNFIPSNPSNRLAIKMWKTSGSYAGDGQSNVKLWGLQLNHGTGLNAYEIISDQQIQNSPWWAINANVLPSSYIAPDGSTSAYQIRENTANTQHSAGENLTLIPGQQYVFSTFVQSNNRKLNLIVQNLGGSNFINSTCDPTTGTSSFAQGNVTMNTAPNGWYQCSVTFIPTQANITLWLNDTASSWPYRGDGQSGLNIWGSQLELGSSPTVFQDK